MGFGVATDDRSAEIQRDPGRMVMPPAENCVLEIAPFTGHALSVRIHILVRVIALFVVMGLTVARHVPDDGLAARGEALLGGCGGDG